MNIDPLPTAGASALGPNRLPAAPVAADGPMLNIEPPPTPGASALGPNRLPAAPAGEREGKAGPAAAAAAGCPPPPIAAKLVKPPPPPSAREGAVAPIAGIGESAALALPGGNGAAPRELYEATIACAAAGNLNLSW